VKRGVTPEFVSMSKEIFIPQIQGVTSHFTLPLTDLIGKQRRLPRSDCCATRQGETDSS
jgi:hypothetical protein